ncbi:hypothetical protein [Oceanicoccus sagamiensis]|uniref:Uncharacterized protein n=1 Tax=Oceanicoccus sagamiensis TaxID=716816 RepID=A0A1X9NC95_9GAMM|nr:hypothetical protein [Oceanicoccus sagamiensis]ARN73525.1 hypothetical protein BST96_04960 [Oceanicoccus sagamiensis]
MFRSGDIWGFPNIAIGLAIFTPSFLFFRYVFGPYLKDAKWVHDYSESFTLVFLVLGVIVLIPAYYENKLIWSRWVRMNGPFDLMNISLGLLLGLLSIMFPG